MLNTEEFVLERNVASGKEFAPEIIQILNNNHIETNRTNIRINK